MLFHQQLSAEYQSWLKIDDLLDEVRPYILRTTREQAYYLAVQKTQLIPTKAASRLLLNQVNTTKNFQR